MRITMTFRQAHVFLLNTLARIFDGLAVVAGSFFLVGACAIEANRWTDVVVGLLLIAIGVAVFVAKPVTVATIASMRQRIGRPDK